MVGWGREGSNAKVQKAYDRGGGRGHPEKCGGDPDAAAAFRRLSHAYQVLSDPQLRAAYDRDGASATAEVGFQRRPASDVAPGVRPPARPTGLSPSSFLASVDERTPPHDTQR